MSLKDLALGTVKSEYIKDCITNSNKKLTIKEQITIILNSDEELCTKRDYLRVYLESAETKKELNRNQMRDLQKIIDEINSLYVYIYGYIDNIVLVYKYNAESIGEDDECACSVICSHTLSKLIDRVKESNSNIDKDRICVELHNIDEGRNIGYIKTDLNGAIYEKYLENDISSDLYNEFIEIDTDLHIGDCIRTLYDDTEYVVINEPLTRTKFGGRLEYKDGFVAVVPKNVLNNEVSFKEQIEKVYAERISNIDNPLAKPDMIMENYITVSMLKITR